ncbi:S-layer homology domain-containing protein [Candidatus Gracilibacteria bacterium]|nr:S-layer homology domain-containing protein [Candidatus Gracilibacteria bacterium]
MKIFFQFLKIFLAFGIFFFGIFSFSENTFALNFSQSYIDVPNTRDDYDYIQDLRKKGIIDVKENFYPDDFLTRAELTKIITLGTLGVAYDKIAGYNSFSDVFENDWFYPYVQSARYYHFVKGYPDGTFKPGNDINRAEAMKIILRATGLDLNFESGHFRDFSADEWFTKYANTAFEYGIFEGEIGKNGLPQGIFLPQKKVTRGEMATWFSRALSLSEY